MTLIERSFKEKIILVGVVFPSTDVKMVEKDLEELGSLVRTAGAIPVKSVIQKRDSADPKTFVGKGKAIEIAALSEELDVDTVVFDEGLTPGQQRNLEKIFGRTAIDRTAVILDIFAQNARSEAGVKQVELALISYRLPRLVGRGTSLSQQGGGIGTRGPGETKLETDRRRLLSTMNRLKKDLAKLDDVRKNQRKLRKRNDVKRISLVGYTNVGKSTLLNALTGSDAYVEDRLFATLDSKTKRLVVNDKFECLISDTVGFIRKLPHELVTAFHSTLEEVSEADLLIHVVDASSNDAELEVEAVREVLSEIGARDIPELLVLNKCDKATLQKNLFKDAIEISAEKREGLEHLIDQITFLINQTNEVYKIKVPLSQPELRAKLYEFGKVAKEIVSESEFEITVELSSRAVSELSRLDRHIEGLEHVKV